MPFVSQQILGILDGISQQPDKLRAQSEGRTQINVYDSLVHGKTKRPPSTHVAKLSNTPWTFQGSDGAYIWSVNRDSSERYHVVVNTAATPTCQVFDGTTGQEYTVLAPQGTDYLAIQPPPTFTEIVTVDAPFPGGALGGTALENYAVPGGFSFVAAPPTNSGDATYGPPSGITVVAVHGLEGTNTSANGANTWVNAGDMLDLVPGQADYTVTATIVSTGNTATSWGGGIVARGAKTAQGVGGFGQIGYGLSFGGDNSWNGSADHVGLVRLNPTGSPVTNLAQYALGYRWDAARSTTLSLAVSGTTITVSINGVVAGSVTDATYAAAGYTGLYFGDHSLPSTPNGYVTDFKLVYTAPVTLPPPLQDGLRFCTVQDTTFIANQSQTVEPLRTAASATPVRPFEALISVRQVDYGTNYNVTLDSVSIGFSTTAPSAPNARQQLTTDVITQSLNSEILNNPVLSGQYSTQVFGSTIYITRFDGADFVLTVSDGLSDNALVAIKGSVQAQDLLPARAINGFVIEVQPDPDNQYDAAYYIYDDLGNPSQNGIWRECAAPGLLTTLDNNTMPWALTRLGNVVAGFPADGGPTIAPTEAGFDPVSHTYAIGGSNCIGDQGHTVAITLGAEATGTNGEVMTVTFDVNLVQGPSCSTGALPTAEYVTVTVTDSSQPLKAFSSIFSGGANYPNQVITFPTNAVNTDTITVTLYYSRGSTPPTDHQGNVYVHQNTDPIPGFVLGVPKATGLTFSNQQSYPQGVTYTIAVTSSPTESHTLTPSSDLTNVSLATALAALAWSSYTASTPTPGTLVLTPTSGSIAPTVTFSTNWDITKQYHNGALQLVADQLAGYALQDLTDGSTGVVSSNTVTTITLVSALAGGVTNTFRRGDLVSVQGPAGTFYFVLQPINWTPRGVGDDNTNPFPSFTYGPIVEIGFTSDRIVLFSGENIVCSGAGDLFNFFRTTVVTLLDSDRIDVTANSQTVSDWNAMVHWAEGVWLFAGNVQAQLPTQPALSNSTVSILPQTFYQSAPTLRPLAMDRRIYFARERTGNMPVTQIFRYQRIRFPFFGFIAEEATKKIPILMEGSPLQLVGDPTLEIMFVLTDAAPNQLYPYIFHYDESQQLQQESWSVWEFDPRATILNVDMLDGHLGLIISRPDGVYLEDIDLQIALYDAL